MTDSYKKFDLENFIILILQEIQQNLRSNFDKWSSQIELKHEFPN